MLDQHLGDPSRFLCRGSARGGDPSSGIWRPWVEECKAHRDECVLGQLGRFIEHDLEASSTSGGDFCPPVGRTHSRFTSDQRQQQRHSCPAWKDLRLQVGPIWQEECAVLSETLKTSSLLATELGGNMRLQHAQSGHSVSKT